MTITDIEEALGNDRGASLTLVLKSGLQRVLNPDSYGRTNDGKRLFIPVGEERFSIVETESVKTIMK